jgi:hypothetical protein
MVLREGKPKNKKNGSRSRLYCTVSSTEMGRLDKRRKGLAGGATVRGGFQRLQPSGPSQAPGPITACMTFCSDCASTVFSFPEPFGPRSFCCACCSLQLIRDGAEDRRDSNSAASSAVCLQDLQPGPSSHSCRRSRRQAVFASIDANWLHDQLITNCQDRTGQDDGMEGCRV